MSLSKSFKKGLRSILHSTLNKPTHITASVSYIQASQRLQGKRIVVTGGGRGLGFAMAKRFKEEGAQVLIAGRNEEKLRESAQAIDCLYLKLDLTDVESIEDFINKAWEELGGIDCLVNNAGISLHEGNICKVRVEDFDSQIKTNLRGPYFLSQQYITKYESNSCTEGNILFISSERGSMADDLPYGLTKAATNSLVQGLAYLFVKKGIRVNALSPGVTTSDMTGIKADGNLYKGYQMNKRVYLPEEVAETACFLLSDASRLINGQIIVIDEGKTVNFRR